MEEPAAAAAGTHASKRPGELLAARLGGLGRRLPSLRVCARGYYVVADGVGSKDNRTSFCIW